MTPATGICLYKVIKNRATSDEDAPLVARARHGDHRAFEELVRRHKDSVLNLARFIVADDDAAEDVAQESFIKAYQHLHRFRGGARFSTWLCRITVNQARAHLRSERRRLARWEKQLDLEETRTEAAQPKEERGPLLALLQQLPEKQRAALALFYLHELSLAEIAHAMKAPAGTVKSWLSRGRERLRAMAQQEGLL